MTESRNSTSRRAILAGGVGAVFALVADAIGRPRAAAATDGEAMFVGGNYTATTATRLNASGTTTAFFGYSAMGTGLYGQSDQGVGVFGYTPGGGVPIEGKGYGDAPGVIGGSTTMPAPSPRPTKTGVFGWAFQDSSARGVHGQSTSGRGVYGQATNGRGLYGYATSGSAIYGTATTGLALQTSGRIRFEKSAGVATIGAGKSTLTIKPGIPLTTSSAIVATLNGNAGTASVRRVSVDITADTFTVVLTASATSAARIAWFIVS